MQVISELSLPLDVNDEPTEDPNLAVSIRSITLYDDGSSEVEDVYLNQPEDDTSTNEDTTINNPNK